MKKTILLFALLSLSISSFAQTSVMPRSSFYGGLGGSFNLVSFSAMDASTLGLSRVFIGNTNVTSGSANGPYEVGATSENMIGPSVQLGYFQKFDNSQWLWGTKLTYNYVGATNTTGEQDIPQYGSNTQGNTFDGVAVVQSYENSIYSQFTLTPFFGYSVKQAFFYIGGGPALSYIKEGIIGVVGYAFVNGDTVNISGTPTDFSSSDWVFGFTGIAGGTYFFSQSIFLDICYNFNPTFDQTNDYNSPFSNSNGPFSTSGELIGSTTRHVTTNTFTLTVNLIL